MRTFLCGILLLLSSSVFAEIYVLAVVWFPEVCANNSKIPECQLIPLKNFSAQRLYLHGVWPQAKDYCTVNPDDRRKDKEGNWINLPEVALSEETRSLLTKVMPGSRFGLDRHEWIKHGSCAGVSQEVYFKVAANLTKRLESTNFATALRSHTGEKISLAALKKIANSDFGGNAQNGIEYLCTVRKNGSQYLREVRFHLEADSIEELDLSDSVSKPVRRSNWLCQDGPIYIRR